MGISKLVTFFSFFSLTTKMKNKFYIEMTPASCMSVLIWYMLHQLKRYRNHIPVPLTQ